ncbi:MAG: Phosphatidylglycerophosphatase A [Methanosaeta sp. PtaU1.Bin060]|nr:MAG: Phosphatidylglycerophosphatase A [Methanosaeta sp. PtaU1.Bin060]
MDDPRDIRRSFILSPQMSQGSHASSSMSWAVVSSDRASPNTQIFFYPTPPPSHIMANRDIRDVLASMGITLDDIVFAALELYFPHPGVETREKAEAKFRREMDLALSDPNLALLIYAGVLLEEEGHRAALPNLKASDYENDLTCLIADEVLGLSIAQYIAGYKGLFDYIRYDKAKPGILGTLGPFMDDVIAGLIGGVSSNMYTRAVLD